MVRQKAGRRRQRLNLSWLTVRGLPVALSVMLITTATRGLSRGAKSGADVTTRVRGDRYVTSIGLRKVSSRDGNIVHDKVGIAGIL
jgi:hypothetical protein